jgi:hypothetical protein
MDKFTITLAVDQINVILAALAEKPLKDVLAVFTVIQTQIQEQAKAKEAVAQFNAMANGSKANPAYEPGLQPNGLE